jgi:hypothetical protein
MLGFLTFATSRETMDIYIDLHFDRLSGSRDEITSHWFKVSLQSICRDLLDLRTPWFASVTPVEGEEPVRFRSADKPERFTEEIRDPFYAAQVIFFDGENEQGRLSSMPMGPFAEHSVVSMSLRCTESAIADPDFCHSLVNAVSDAASLANPTFGRVEDQRSTDRSNLDIALRRKPRVFLQGSREILRGYAWVTVCPAELVPRVGGIERLRNSGAFRRVIPLRSGGMLLQSTETLAEYSEHTMERVFEALAPALPPGMPKEHPAFPDVRFVARDACQYTAD